MSPDGPRIAVVHYHARPGGVSRVIRQTMEVLSAEAELTVLLGEPPPEHDPLAARCTVIPELAYSAEDASAPQPGLADRLRAAAQDALGAAPDLWHIHNHSLGKSPALTRAVAELARRGERLLLQIHDFAEDGRPADYRRLSRALGVDALRRTLYPDAPHVHYALLNNRDRNLLAAAGLDPARLHLLPNPVRTPASSSGAEGASRGADDRPATVVYPVRAIRRKNIGEFLLWSLLRPERRFAITLAPRNPRARPVYEDWVRYAADRGLPLEFEAAGPGGEDFPALIERAAALATTSVAEGFGLAFLEPWLAGKPLTGRDLPEITADFKACGIDLSALYDRLAVPAEWIDSAELRRRIGQTLRATRESYGLPFREEHAGRVLEIARSEGPIDFGVLDEDLQRVVLDRLSEDPGARRELDIPDAFPAADVITHNRGIVQREYAPDRFAARLLELYRATAGSAAAAPDHAADPARLIDAFLAPKRFTLLRT
ncbi:glycosyltransferase family 4 protein [Kiritimatiella glycovorans]|uniref:Glycosyltransferase, family n=1 Tax=Kiritimatiella glycovorans TaxID=1307763 RepID=A0A0G3EDN2_9BACT|nr:glycosyltransferase family 4 protein [Kiritimatiella glycovorans]AKJ63507.1 glycosyltransferase, family [Kiritimatiella glycovorans]